MKLTDEQLAEIADKGALAASNCADGNLLVVGDHHGAYVKHQEARQAFARTVIDLALAQLAGGEEDLVSETDSRWCTIFAKESRESVLGEINTRHRQAMAALRAQMQGEIDALADWKAQAMRVESEWDEQQIAKLLGGQLGESCRKVIQKVVPFLVAENSELKEALSLLDNVYGNPGSTPKTLCEDVLKVIEVQKQRAEAAEKELAALKQQAPADREAFDALEAIAKYDSGNGCCPYGCDCPTIAQAALAHKQPWIPCAQRLPTREDGDVRGEVLWNWTSLNEVVARKWNWAHRTSATHWMPIPPLPTAPTAEKLPAPPEGFHLASEDERKCLPKGYKVKWKELKEGWRDGRDFGRPAQFDMDYACPNTPPLVTFTNGKINPPPYGSWHRSDWSPEMLPDGYRPLMKGETGTYEASYEGAKGLSWMRGMEESTPAQEYQPHQRTRRPLPPAPEKEKEPEWVCAIKDDLKMQCLFAALPSEVQRKVVAEWERIGIVGDEG